MSKGYTGARQVIQPSEAFSLDDAATFKYFIGTQGLSSERPLARLQLQTDWALAEPKKRNIAHNIALLRSPNGLRHLRL